MKPPFHRPGKARRSAYILLEVLLATAIFAMAGVSLAVVLNGAISAGMDTQRETRVVWSLESRLNETRLAKLDPGTDKSPPDADGIVYEREISTVDLKNEKDQSLNGLYNIKITARWKEDNHERDLSAQTYVYRP